MAGVAGDPSGVIGRGNLREISRLGTVGFMTAGTHDGRVQLFGLHRSRVVRMLSQSPVASLASNHHMLAQFFLLQDVGMAGLAGIVPGKCNRPGCHLANRMPSIVAILPKTLRYYSGSQKQEDHQRYGDDASQPNEVFDVFKQISVPAPIVPGAICARN